MNIKSGDTVVILSGKDKGKEGKVLSADPRNSKIVVEGINIAYKHKKPRKQGEEGGIVKMETPIYVSKAMRVCPKCGKPTRAAHKILDDGTKTRICKKCAETI
ncbi:MAG: 50S ribosomal protein L24 [Clostridiales bacterium]|nr:50S ribosomal protein L24 [Clostridiales bacterium]